MSVFKPRPRPTRRSTPADPYKQALALAEQLRTQRRAADQQAR